MKTNKKEHLYIAFKAPSLTLFKTIIMQLAPVTSFYAEFVGFVSFVRTNDSFCVKKKKRIC